MSERVRKKNNSVERKSEMFKFRLTPTEKNRLEALAGARDISCGQYIRTRLLKPDSKHPNQEVSPDAWEKVRDYSKYLSGINKLDADVGHLRNDAVRIGNNINQIARSMNALVMAKNNRASMSDVASKESLDKLTNAVNTYTRKIDEFIARVDSLPKPNEDLGGEV